MAPEQVPADLSSEISATSGNSSTQAPGEEKENDSSTVKTLGVLFVHGIGTQKRGDTIAQCGTSMHNWIQKWINQPENENGNIIVELIDTSLTQNISGEPAHSRLFFRKENELSRLSWLLTESCWAESFSAPKYSQFVRWALRVLPLAAIMHVFVPFRRNLRIMNITETGTGEMYLPEETLYQLNRDLGPQHGSLFTRGAAELGKFLHDQGFLASHRWFITPLSLVPFLLLAICVLPFLIVLMIFGLLPFDFLRNFAGKVQKKLSAILGDSYLFVVSPISASAAVTQVKKDIEWLAGRCDRVVVLAHSQGAAIAHRAIQEWSWEDRVPKNLQILITYGSGLRKLFDLQQLSKDLGPANNRLKTLAFTMVVFGSTSIMSVLVWILWGIPFWTFSIFFVLGYFFVLLGMTSLDITIGKTAPESLTKVKWVDLFASNDPVSNGPLELAQPKGRSTGNKFVDDNLKLAFQGVADILFEGHEVVNLKSNIADHTKYWSAADDFVSHVMRILMQVSDFPHPGSQDKEWIDLSEKRRHWRVGLLARCRKIALFAAICFAFWPVEAIRKWGVIVNRWFSEVVSSVPEDYLPGWMSDVSIPDIVTGFIAIFFCLYCLFMIAKIGWNRWENIEISRFFHRRPYTNEIFSMIIFSSGWLGILLFAPVITAFAAGGQFLKPAIWTTSLLMAMTFRMIYKSRKIPGRASEWIRAVLEKGEGFLEHKGKNRSENLTCAAECFSNVEKWRCKDKNSTERLQALIGVIQINKEKEIIPKEELIKIIDDCEKVFASFKRKGKNIETLRLRFDQLTGKAP
jgi:hypothetical protein